MQVHSPDPRFTVSARAGENFRLAVRIAAVFVGFLWLIELSNALLGLGPPELGVRPREPEGLVGILLAPMLHAGFEHLVANTGPLAIGLVVMLHLYPSSVRWVLPSIWLGPGIAVWLFARGGNHLGASGLVYGLVAYVLVGGLLRRDRRAIAASMAMC